MSRSTLYDHLRSHAAEGPDRIVLTHGRRRVGYGELLERCERLAGWLADRGLQPGDRLGIHLHKSVEEVVAILAAMRLGAVFVDIHYSWTPAQVAHVAGDCGLRALVTDARRARVLRDAGASIPIVRIGTGDDPPEALGWESSGPGEEGRRDGVPEELAALFYTSGSTGSPKGVMVGHRQLLDGARIVAGYLGNRAEDRVLSVLPLSFDYGMNQLATMLHVGGRLVLQPVVFPAEIVETIVAQEVTGLPMVPPLWVQLVRYLEASGRRLPSLRYVTNTGGRIPTPVLEAMPRVLPDVEIFLMYGLTEAFRSTFLPPEQFEAKRGAIGYAIPEVEIFVVDPVRGVVGPGEIGELVHRGRLISMGYWGNREASARRIRPSRHLAERIGDEPVLFSGDLVRLDEEGCLWFEGRMDDMIKSSGYRISPTEVEDPVYASGLVSGAVAFGVADEELGEVVHLAVETSSSGSLEPETLLDLCRRSLPSYMVPRRLHDWPDEMPRTSSGKIDRARVVESLRAAMAVAVGAEDREANEPG